MFRNVKLLDCTLRDGGHMIDSNFGRKVIDSLIDKLAMSNIDIIELGFLRNVKYNPEMAIFNDISQAKNIIKNYKNINTKFSLLAQADQYDASLLPVNDGIIDFIRVSFHINKLDLGMQFCEIAKNKGYKVYCNPINIKGYTDIDVLETIKIVNKIKPYTFTIVDTFGSMQRDDLRRLVYLLLNNLDEEINLAVHLHENMSQSFSLAQEVLSMNLHNRELTIDGSLRGMGRIPGNLPIELIADYMNKYCGKSYKMDYFFDAIENHINYFFNLIGWGYDPIYSLAAQYNLHRTYAEYLKNTGKLGTKDIKVILSQIVDDKKILFDQNYINELYAKYLNVEENDEKSLKALRNIFSDNEVLVIANGISIKNKKYVINEFLKEHPKCLIVSVQFYPEDWNVNYTFFSNLRRYANCHEKNPVKTILTSNIKRISIGTEYIVSYEKLCVKEVASSIRDNSMFMIINLLLSINANSIYLAGFDGYKNTGEDYYSNYYDSLIHPEDVNDKIKRIIEKEYNKYNNIHFLTDSIYINGK